MPLDGVLRDPAVILAPLLDTLLPSPEISVSECAERHRVVLSGAYPGPWRNAMAPYLVEPMDALLDPRLTSVVVVGPGQSAKTAIAENWFLHTVLYDPTNVLWYLPTEDVMDFFLRDRIGPLVDAHEAVKERLGRLRGDDNLRTKRFRGMLAAWLHASKSNLISKTAPKLILDEEDACDAADPAGQIDVRRVTYGDHSMLLRISHPDLGDRGVMGGYKQSDQRRWYWPCPECDLVSTPSPGGRWVSRLHLAAGASADEARRAAGLVCPHCGAVIDDAAKEAMNAQGFWVAQGQTLDPDGTLGGERTPGPRAGFWIHGAMSPFVGWNYLAGKWAEARRSLHETQDEDPLRQFVVKGLGEVYTAQHAGVGPLEPEALKARGEAGWRLGTVPEGVRYLTAGIDSQAGGWDVLVRGWSETAESWLVDRYDLTALADGTALDPANLPEHWDELLRRVVMAVYPLAADPGLVLPLASVAIDSHGLAGVTTQARAALRRWRAAGLEHWRCCLIRGANKIDAPILGSLSREKDDDGRELPGGVEIHNVGVHRLKDVIDARLRLAQVGPGWMRWPDDAPAEYFDELVAERREKGRWTKTGPNESWDCEVYAEFARQRLRVERVDWTRPPDWARPLERRLAVPATAPAAAVAPIIATPLPLPTAIGAGRRIRSRGI